MTGGLGLATFIYVSWGHVSLQQLKRKESPAVFSPTCRSNYKYQVAEPS